MIPNPPYNESAYGVTSADSVLGKNTPSPGLNPVRKYSYQYPMNRRAALIMFQQCVSNSRPCKLVWFDDAQNNNAVTIAIYPGPA